MGKTMMDQGNGDDLIEDTDRSLQESIDLYRKWNRATPRIEYIFSPRFALSCSFELMKKIGEFARENNAYIQTHLSENKDEIEQALKLFPEAKSYTQIYEKAGILSPRTLLGHVIHVDDEELELIGSTGSKVVHCPDSNFFLKSGRFPLEKYREKNIEFGLGSDVGAGTQLSMLNTMKMFNYTQREIIVTPEEAFYRATLGNARLLNKDHLIGSIDTGKEADLVFLKPPESIEFNRNDLLSSLLYLDKEIEVKRVYISGDSVLEN